jgi:hypothetical protein
MEKRRCKNCGCLFQVCSRVAKHEYCDKEECQRTRKRQWQKRKRATDPAYRANQQDAQERWREVHPDYWKNYRANHPLYTERNREKQRERNRLRRQKKADASILKPIAKMDTIPPENVIFSGTYRLIPFDAQGIAKMDAKIVQLSVISRDNPNLVGIAKR